MTKEEIRQTLFSLRDTKYRDFTAKLIPTVPPDKIIGVRTPDVRKFAAELYKSGDFMNFLNSLPHEYYEENNLHAFLIEKIGDYETAEAETEKFLPYIDNWATCDTMSPKVFKKNLPKLSKKIEEWIKSDKTYSVRFAINMLMKYFLGENFKKEYADKVASVKSDEYYVKMCAAWYFATALAKNYEETVCYLENRRLDEWTHNKTVRKALESYRIPDDRKQYLRTLTIR